MLAQFQKFLKDKEADAFFLTGVAGTGKTTSLKQLVDYCTDNDISNITCAYTHRACLVLGAKLRKDALICTLHSFLKKRPTINDAAKVIAHVESNAQLGVPDRVKVLFIDEFSMVGEKDYVDIAALQYDEEGELLTKVVYIGDPNQLPPVKDVKAIVPCGPHWVKLTQIYRQAGDSPLIDTLLKLNDYINGEDAEALKEHSCFVRNQDIIKLYKECKTSKVLLAYTNEQVQNLNALVQGYEKPKLRDTLFSSTTREAYDLEAIDKTADSIVTIRGQILELDSKYKTLETLHDIEGVQFYTLEDNNGNLMQRAVVFGHKNFLKVQEELARQAVLINNVILKQFGMEAKAWAKDNWSHELAKKRAKAWSRYLAFKDNVLCIDFAHAMTVHKSQGSTYDNVFLDMEDMSKCAKNDYQLYLKLLYVAISRARDKVYTN